MPARPRDIGTRVESAVASYLNDRGMVAKREVLHGSQGDQGDIHVISQGGSLCVIECKAGRMAETASIEQIHRWVQEAEREGGYARADYAFAVTKVAGRGSARVKDWGLHCRAPWGGIVTMRLEMLPAHVGWLEEWTLRV